MRRSETAANSSVPSSLNSRDTTHLLVVVPWLVVSRPEAALAMLVPAMSAGPRM